MSCRNGAEVKADVKTTDIQDKERFQFEINDGIVHIMTDKLKYWVPRDDHSISIETDKQSDATAFVVDVRDDCIVAFDPTIIVWFPFQYSGGNTVKFIHKASGKHVWCKPNGAMFANGDGSEATSDFELTMINRPTLILRGQYGFVGVKGASGRVECNRARGDVFNMESKNGEYYLSKNGEMFFTCDAMLNRSGLRVFFPVFLC